MNPILGPPTHVAVQHAEGWTRLDSTGEGAYESRFVRVGAHATDSGIEIVIDPTKQLLLTLRCTWRLEIPSHARLFGDDWERGYGRLEWRGIVPERTMPWYMMIHDIETARSCGIGIATGCAGFVFWQADGECLAMQADISCGGEGISLDRRELKFGTIVPLESAESESPYEFGRRFCKTLCRAPVLPEQPIYGGNNWYYAYGDSSSGKILEDSRFISDCAKNENSRPFMVIDGGWHTDRDAASGGPWYGNDRFGDMGSLAEEMHGLGVRPGIWCRPLMTSIAQPESWIRRTTDSGHVLDPTVPEVANDITQTFKRFAAWGYELVKHDFTTYDLLGQWGYEMKRRPHGFRKAFLDRTRTTLEVISDLYRIIADALGSSVVIGCNTVGHVAAGTFAVHRTGDDTSGRWWERTRYMGVNSLAFRMIQHDTFYSIDADCVGIGDTIPWELNAQWLDLLARSGTALFVSVDPNTATRDQSAAIRNAFSLASERRTPAEPLDWMGSTSPRHWRFDDVDRSYSWGGVRETEDVEHDNGWWLG